jgi:hypothetical protein
MERLTTRPRPLFPIVLQRNFANELIETQESFLYHLSDMTAEEFEEKRARQWHERSEFALTTEREIFEFIQSVGAATLFLAKKPLFPSLVQAINGSSHRGHPQGYSNSPSAELIEKFMSRYFKSRQVFEVSLVQNNRGVVSREWMIALFALLGESHFGRSRRGYSIKPKFSGFELAVYDLIQRKGPISQKHLMLALNIWDNRSRCRLRKALARLWKALKILRVGYTRQEGTLWDTPIRWDPSLRREASAVSREKAAAELLNKYITMAVATNRKRLSRAFAGILTPTQVAEGLRYLLLKKSIVVDRELVLDGKKALTAGH